MDIRETSIKMIVHAIEEYYQGQQIRRICKTYEITPAIFNSWLADYKEIVLELMTLKIENEKLRKLLVEFIISRPTTKTKNKRNNNS